MREIKAKKGAAVWRREEKAEQAYSLKLTAAGLKAMVANEDEAKPVVVCDASATVDRVSASATHRALHRTHRRFVIASLRNRQYSV